ncbi:MAG: FG-GAP-like repeat-containing protein, partial [Acidobacteria bacterium]|nr:FG-GAP-like repeat-containing protein [Acidobacteriota bacterium]
MAIDPLTPSKLYASTYSPSSPDTNVLSISTDGGDSWAPAIIPPIFGGTLGPIESIAADPITPGTVYIGVTNGVYKSINGGATWSFAGNGLPISFPPSLPVKIVGISISPSNPATIYAVADIATIFKTTNAGASWFQLNTPEIGPPIILRVPLVVAFDNPQVVYVGSRNSGLFRSDDGGINWNTINNGMHAKDTRALAIDPNSPGRIYTGAFNSTEAFVAKLNNTGSSFIYSSYIGGGATDTGRAIVIDSTGAAYLAGSTNSPNFPVANAFQATLAGQSDAFVAKVNSSGSAISWATYLGGSNTDNAFGIAVSITDEVSVTGTTSSSDFPLNKAFQPFFRGLEDGFITRLKNNGSTLDFSTYLGGTGFDSGLAIALDHTGNIYVTGATGSLDFPVIDAIQSARSGDPAIGIPDAFVTKLTPTGTAIVYSTYLGGSDGETGRSIAIDAAANAYVTGTTSSSDFPTTPFPIRSAVSSIDAFVAKLGVFTADLAVNLTGTPNPVMKNNQHTYSLIVTNNGPDPAINVRVIDTLPGGVSLISAITSQGNCSGTSEIICELGDLAVGSSAEITIIVSPSNIGTITNRASVTSISFDANPVNNSTTLETSVSELPSIYGRVTTAGGAGLNGVSVPLSGAGRPPLTTTVNGNYQFAELSAGRNYTVTPSLQGYVFNPPNRTINNLQRDERVDFQGAACIFSISSARQSFPATGGVGSVTITSSDPRCVWTASSNVPWIKFISAPTGNGTAVVRFRVEPTVGSRTGTLTIGGNKLTVIQEFNPCSTLSFKTTKFISLGGIPFVSGTTSKIVAEDFNKDSVSDLVINRSPSSASLTLSLSNSTGGYDNARLLFNGAVSTFRTGDLNKDGKGDLVLITREQPARLLILTGDGMGGFSAPVSIETGPLPRHLAIADFNNDNIPDLAVVTDPLTPDPTRSNYNLAIYPGDGMGGFAPPTHIGFTTRPRSIPVAMEAGDFNADGKPDLAVVGILGPVIIFTSDSAAGFTITRIEDIETASEEGWMELGDFNGDRKIDLALRHNEAGRSLISIWLSTSSGMFQRAFSIDARNFGNKFLAADLNGDGKSDLGVTLGNSFVVRYAKSDGNFSEPVSYLMGFRVIQPTLGDFKQDGRDLRTDIIVPTVLFNDLPPGPPAAILRSNGLGDFDAPRSFEFFSDGSIDRAEMESADLNGDGVLDLAIADILLNDVVMMFGNGRGEFTPPVKINSGVTNGRATDIELRDFNNDGKTDLAILNFETQNVVVLLGNGRGEFIQSAIFNTGPFPRNIASADFNNDGNFDLIATAQSGGLALFLGNGQGGFTQSVTGIGGNSTNLIFNTGDFNGDGSADLAFSDNDQNPFPNGVKIVVLFGNGQGEFGNSADVITQNVFNSIRSINTSDLNLDGRGDLIYTLDLINDPVLIALSNPGESFATPVRFQSDFNTFNVKPKDINGDGIPDLIIPLSRKIFVLLGKGDGSFEQPVSLMDYEFPGLIIADDFDEDGTTDLAIARGNVGILLNRSFCVPQGNVVPISTASKFRYRVASNSIVTLQGENLATTTLAAIPLLLPTTLANTRVKITDSAGIERFAQLSFVSPNRITLLIPPQTSPGVALITVTN